MPVPEDYREAPLKCNANYKAKILKLKELEDISLRFRYVKGGPTLIDGFFILVPKDQSDIIEPDDHNSLVDFFKAFYEFILIALGGEG